MSKKIINLLFLLLFAISINAQTLTPAPAPKSPYTGRTSTVSLTGNKYDANTNKVSFEMSAKGANTSGTATGQIIAWIETTNLSNVKVFINDVEAANFNTTMYKVTSKLYNFTIRVEGTPTDKTKPAGVTAIVGGTTTANNAQVNGLTKINPPSQSSTYLYNYGGYVGGDGLMNKDFMFCTKPAKTTGGSILETPVGITDLGTGGVNSWPMVRKGGWIALESNNKGFVVTRMSTSQITAISAPQEGMMVYDTTTKCLKLYNGIEWKCFSKPVCPKF